MSRKVMKSLLLVLALAGCGTVTTTTTACPSQAPLVYPKDIAAHRDAECRAIGRGYRLNMIMFGGSFSCSSDQGALLNFDGDKVR